MERWNDSERLEAWNVKRQVLCNQPHHLIEWPSSIPFLIGDAFQEYIHQEIILWAQKARICPNPTYLTTFLKLYFRVVQDQFTVWFIEATVYRD
jgi:hypothetical protein